MNKIIRLKSLISSILVVALFNLCGCTSFSALTEEETANYHPTKEDDTKFILNDGSEIIYESKFSPKEFLVRIDEPSDLIYGSGRILSKGQRRSIIFEGKIPREMIDSTSSRYINKQLHQEFWLTNGDLVRLKQGGYVDITPDDGIGYLVSGRKRVSGGKLLVPFIGKIDFGEIDEIQADENKEVRDILTTGLTVISVASLVLMVVALVLIVKYNNEH